MPSGLPLEFQAKSNDEMVGLVMVKLVGIYIVVETGSIGHSRVVAETVAGVVSIASLLRAFTWKSYNVPQVKPVNW